MIKAFLAIWQSFFFGIVGILGIGFIIAFNEFGHYIFSRAFVIRVPTFSIGFGPRLLTKKIGETEFTLSAIPLGGYVDLSSPEGWEHDEYSFTKRPYYQKLLVMLGGIGFNIIFAYFAFTLLFMTGIPKTRMLFPINAKPIIASIAPGSPAE